jgi:hypothetical protein
MARRRWQGGVRRPWCGRMDSGTRAELDVDVGAGREQAKAVVVGELAEAGRTAQSNWQVVFPSPSCWSRRRRIRRDSSAYVNSGPPRLCDAACDRDGRGGDRGMFNGEETAAPPRLNPTRGSVRSNQRVEEENVRSLTGRWALLLGKGLRRWIGFGRWMCMANLRYIVPC